MVGFGFPKGVVAEPRLESKALLVNIHWKVLHVVHMLWFSTRLYKGILESFGICLQSTIVHQIPIYMPTFFIRS